jgi:ABC-2 type transport system ATP-binding protein
MTEQLDGAWAVELAGVFHRYRGVPGRQGAALRGLDLRVRRGTICGLIGPIGSGKSTTLRLCAGLLEPAVGAVRILGRPATDAAARARIGYAPELPEFPAWMKAEEFLRFAAELSGLAGREVGAAVSAVLRATRLEALAERRGRELSKGEKQRLGLAQAILHRPDVLLLDEPASGLDPIGVRALAATLDAQRGRGATVLVASHFLPQLAAVCDEVRLFGAGRIIWEGTPSAGGDLEELFISHASRHAAAN